MEKDHSRILQNLRKAVEEFDAEKAREAAIEAVKSGFDPVKAIEEGLAKGIKTIGDLFEKGEIFLPELIMAAEAMKAGTQILMDEVRKRGLNVKKLGKVVIGTVHGDIHDIGKNIVISMLEASGFKVIDLGVDVPTEKFVAKVKEVKPDILAMSALLTTTMTKMEEVIKALEKENLRGKVKVMVGGAPVSEEWAKKIGADGYGADAMEAVVTARSLLKL